jgi:mannose-6-phosphate isomerase-like protein (cupin superfamily)
MKQIIKRILFWKAVIIIGYFVIGIIFHHYLFPPQKPDYASYFKTGDKFSSNWEGFEQTVISQKDGWLNTKVVMRPKSAGPPVHIHENFDEVFTVKEGTLSVLINGEKKIVRAGESVNIPKGTPHKPFNETEFPVLVGDENSKSFPLEFAYHLSQIYLFIDSLNGNPGDLQMIMQFSVYGDGFDSWMADGPPIGVQKVTRFVMAPTAHLLGYKNYYEEYRIKN